MESYNMSSGSQMTKSFQSDRKNNSMSSQDVSRSSSFADEDDNVHETPKRRKIDSLYEGLSCSDNTNSVLCSPWEYNRMKGETIALKTKVSSLEETIKRLHRVRNEVEEIFNKEKRLLEIEINRDRSVIKQLELRLDFAKKSAQEAKSAQAYAERDLNQMKAKMNHKILELMENNTKLKEELRKCANQDIKPDFDAIRSENKAQALEEQIKATQNRVVELEKKLKEARDSLKTFEIQGVELQKLKMKCENLESEKTLWEEGKKLYNRAVRATELEKELDSAKQIIFSMRECIKGKLLLEEQLATMEQKLQRTEALEKQISQLEVMQGELLSKISDYEAIGITGGPIAVRREISRLQQAEIILTAEEGQLRSKVDSIERELQAAQKKCEETKKQVAETSNSNERLSRFISRLQKKMSLVTRERDSYRQQLDTYEKEITGYQNTETPSLLSERIPALERTVDGYRDLIAKYEADLEIVDGKSPKEEIKKLKNEIDKLKGELEHRALKGDFNINSRILHFTMNPAAIAIEQAEEKQKALLQEVEKLRAIVSSGSYSGPAPVSSLQAQEIAEQQQKHDLKIQRLKEAFKASSHEYRQACYQLFGWRVDRTKEGQYKLSSQYAESPDDYLFFLVNEDGVNMIETPFSATLTTFIERHLKLQHSVPMFLNAVQSDLFDQQTVTNVITS